MSYYKRHVFFCCNQREPPENCCNNHGSAEMQAYAKQRIKELRLDGKGKVTVSRAGKEVIEGTYKVNNDEIELTDEKGPFAGTGDAKTGTYKWKLEGAKLTFTKLKDESEGRSRILTTGAWERKEKE